MQKMATLFAVLFVFTAIDARADLVNGSFETTVPPVPVGNFSLFAPGSTGVTGWTVVGPGMDIGVVNTTFAQSGISFVAQNGSNWVDLTGLNANSVEGVAQAAATTIGHSYTLTFFVGNVDSPATGFGVTSTVNLSANSTPLGSFTNSCTACTTTQAWQMFTSTFVATSATTNLTFLNADPANDNDNGLDNVSLVDNGPATVPEPSSIILLGVALLAVAFCARSFSS